MAEVNGKQIESCSSCRFNLKKLHEGRVLNYCRRNPPMPMLMPGPNGQPAMAAIYPQLGGADWCGEWKKRGPEHD